MQIVAEGPLTLYDGAHNPSGIAALAAALPDVLEGRRPVVVVSVLDDKDAAAMLRELLPLAAGAVFTLLDQPARALAGDARVAGRPARRRAARSSPTRTVRVERARELAGAGGAVVATGSIYLVADLLGEPGARRRSAL